MQSGLNFTNFFIYHLFFRQVVSRKVGLHFWTPTSLHNQGYKITNAKWKKLEYSSNESFILSLDFFAVYDKFAKYWFFFVEYY